MSAQWYYADSSNQQLGPASVEAMQAAHARGDLTANSLVWREGMAEWQPMRQMAAELGISVAQTPPPRASAQAAARPVIVAPKGSPWVLILVIAGAVILFGGAILAAIAIPAYNDYTRRAKLGNAVALASAVKLDMEEFVLTNDRCPDSDDAGFDDPTLHAEGMLQAINVGIVDDGTERCAISLTLTGVEQTGDTHSLLMIRNDGSDWVYESTVPARLLPMSVRSRLQ